MNFGPLTNSTTQCGDFSLLSTQNKKENLNVKKTCRNISQVILNVLFNYLNEE